MFDFLKKKEVEKLSLAQFGSEESWNWQGHHIVFTVTGRGQPLLMLHGINASSWAFEFRHNLKALSQQYRIYAPDLPGFGRSERKPIQYTAEMYLEFITDFARFVGEREGQAPATLSTSLTAAHLVGAAAKNPDLFGPLMLVCPTGLERLNFAPGKGANRARKVLFGPVGSVVFSLITGKRSTRLFLGRDGYYDPNFMNEELLQGYYNSSHQPNAKYAPFCFITFGLNYSIEEQWAGIKQPVVIMWGREAKITPLENAARFLQERPGTELKIFERCRLAPYDEQSKDFNLFALEWLSTHYSSRVSQVYKVA